uniref:Zinc finger CCCH domain-containing protein 24 n=1 Tax=Rhizophora mucronata TaxID=61149 RepID=A0A2P2P5G7_RHIMU
MYLDKKIKKIQGTNLENAVREIANLKFLIWS